MKKSIAPVFAAAQFLFCSFSIAAPPAQEIIHAHQLERTGPVGIWLNSTYRSSIQVIPGHLYDGTSTRAAASQITFLQERGQSSGWNTRKFEETWTYLLGDSLLIHVISAQGEHTVIKVGDPLTDPESLPIFTLKSEGQTIATELSVDATAGYFFGTAQTSPGFEIEDISFDKLSNLLKTFPQHEALIKRLNL